MGRLALVAILCSGIGFFAGRSLRSSSPDSTSTTSPNLENLQRLADVDLVEYYRLKTMEERYKKADEILGKMVGIFLADLGLRVSSGVEISRNEPLLQPLECTPALASEAKATPVEETSALTALVATVSSATPAPTGPNRPMLESLRSDSEIAEFLKNSQIRDFDAALKGSSAFSNQTSTLDSLKGRFTGTANVVNSKGVAEVWDAEFTLNARIGTAGRFRGSYTLKFAKNGRVFSNKSGNGNLGDEYREWKDDPEVIFIEASPDTFLQAYYLKNSDSIIANILEQPNRSSPYKTIGTLRMTRN